ncbi:MAG: alpha/beta hydrolase [Anaerolineae bacterium]|nr:alpha/beta hydrolase [Anaerolineae bacterium]
MTDHWSSGDVVANGLKLHYYRTGGDKPPVVLAHGITDNGLCWTRLAQALEKDYDLIMYDARGHGLSDVPAAGYSHQDHAADIADLVEALDLAKPALIGHSMGAGNVAVTVVTYPDLACGAILEDPPWRKDYTLAGLETGAQEWWVEIMERKSKTVEDILAAGRAAHPTWAEVEWPAWVRAKLQVRPEVVQWIGAEILFSYWQKLIPRITCPTLLITADPTLEAIVTPEIAREATRLNPRIQVAHIGGAGHNIRREQFEPYVAAVKKFLSAMFSSKL